MCLEHKQYWQCCLEVDSTYIDSCPLAAAGQRCRTEERVHPIGGYCASCRRTYNKFEDDVCESPKYSRNDGYDRPWESSKPKSNWKPSLGHDSHGYSYNHEKPKEILKRKPTPYAISYTRNSEPPRLNSRDTSSNDQSKDLVSSRSSKKSYNRTSDTKYRPVKSQPLTFPTNYYSYPPPASSSQGPRPKTRKPQCPPPSSKQDAIIVTRAPSSSSASTSKSTSTHHSSYSDRLTKPSTHHPDRDRNYYCDATTKSSQFKSHKSKDDQGSRPQPNKRSTKSNRSYNYDYDDDDEHKYSHPGSRKHRYEYECDSKRPTPTYRVASPDTVSRLLRDGVLPPWVGGDRGGR